MEESSLPFVKKASNFANDLAKEIQDETRRVLNHITPDPKWQKTMILFLAAVIILVRFVQEVIPGREADMFVEWVAKQEWKLFTWFFRKNIRKRYGSFADVEYDTMLTGGPIFLSKRRAKSKKNVSIV